MRLTNVSGSVAAHSALGTALAAALAAGLAMAPAEPALAAPVKRSTASTPARPRALPAPQETVTLSIGRGQLVNLPGTMTDLFVANEGVADVQVKSNRQLYVFGKGAGETTVYATDRAGSVVWSATVRVGQNIASVGSMLKLAMPEATITATPMNGVVLLTGTVASPDDVAEATRLAQAFVGEGVQVVSRLKSATPLQVNLQVKIAEVSRDFVKQVGANLLSRDTTGGFLFGIAQGRNFGSIANRSVAGFPTLDASASFGLPAGSLSLPFNPATNSFILPNSGAEYNLSNLGQGAGRTNIALAGKLLGLDLATVIDLAENNGLVTTLANPNLTALSGETASFLAGGEIPIPQSQGLGAVSVEYKQYGVSLAFTPFVLSDGRISLRVRPEVSQLTTAGSVTLNGFTIPGLSTRRAETTVELGSGQSFMIGGLLSNAHNNSIDKAPGLGDLPIIGALFRSNSFRRQETELVIVVTPYLVKPVDASAIKLPTDGYKAATDAQRILLGQSNDGRTGEQRPVPTMAPPVTQRADGAPTTATPPAASAPSAARPQGEAPAPGFSF
ncbi:type II and III secretion system protein family protein [Sphingomonas jatrophae]|uniref:Pilus assembly protein CpaC n=1 Tax=Sphingomonas jatrophae TaxID=1166337 RepID=A0A1I6JU85_9SPHN|nr:type II and III secretion system protein family protein [Sphingomonas jatrophae]SFR82522.1 pilus assembly protein CpaC [Sphingomonas jatrophae]